MADSKVYCYYNYYLDLKRKLLKVEVKILKDKELLFNKSIGLLFNSYKSINNYILKGIIDLADQFREEFLQYEVMPMNVMIRKDDNLKLFKDLCMDIYGDGYYFTVMDYDKKGFDDLGKLKNSQDNIPITNSGFNDNVAVNIDTGIITLEADMVEDIELIEDIEPVEIVEEKKVKILLKDDYENIVFLDIITNGESKKEIISIGAVKVDIKGETLDAFYSLVKPRINSILSDECIMINNITQEQINSAEDFGSIIQDFIYWVGDIKTLFMTWGEGVIDIILQECERSDIDCEIAYEIDNNYFDLQFEFAKCHLKEEDSISLEESLELYEIDFIKGENEVLDNSMNMLQLYRACEN